MGALRGRQRGAISIATALFMGAMLSMTALSIDAGHAAFEKRDLQKVADLAALDAVQAVGDKRPLLASLVAPTAQQLAEESALRNYHDYPSLTIATELGLGDAEARTFTPTSDPDAANAVRVTVGGGYDYRFLPGALTIEVHSVAITESTAEIMVGSRAASFSSGDSPLLDETLDGLGLGPANLDAVAYSALVGADVTLGDVWATLGLGSPDEILNGQVSLADLVTATIQALDDEGDPISAEAATALGTIAQEQDSQQTFTFGEMICVTETCAAPPAGGGAGVSNPGAAANAQVRVLDLIIMAAEIANGDNLVSITVPQAQVPGVASGTVAVGFIEKPALDVGPARRDANGVWVTRARTAQVRIQINLVLEGQLIFGLATAPIELPIFLEGGVAVGELTGIGCTAANETAPETVPVTVHAETTALAAHVGIVGSQSLTNPNVPADVEDALFSTLPPDIEVSGRAAATAPGATADLTFIGPFQTRFSRVGATTAGLGPLLAADLQVEATGTGLLPAEALLLTAQVRAQVVAVLTTIDTTLFEPLARALGIKVSGADYSNPDLDCSGRKLIG